MTIKELVDEIPGGEGWWQDDTGKKYLKAAMRLVKLGMSREDAVEFLTELYHAAASEFGN